MPAVWKEVWPRMCDLVSGLIQFCYGSRLAATRRYSIQRSVPVSRKENIAGSVPGTGTVRKFRHIAQCLWRRARDVHFLELAIGKKTKKPAVRRPERIVGAFGALQRMFAQIFKRSNL